MYLCTKPNPASIPAMAARGGAHAHLNRSLKDSGTFSKCPQMYIKRTGSEDNDSGKLPFKYYLLRLCEI